METRSFTIPASNKMMVEDQIEKLNKRAAKLDLVPIVLSWGKAILNDKNVLLLPCEVSGPISVSFAGWQFIATLQHLPTGENIIRAISDDYDIPKDYRTSGSSCEHCRVNRYRKDTYLVRHEDSRVVQVGSTCIKDFLGGNSPDNIMQKASFVAELMSFMGGAGHGPHGHDEGVFHIVTFLSQTSACIRDYGWVPKSKATNDILPTAIRVQDNFSPPMDSRFKRSVITTQDRAIAQQAAEWAENLPDSEADVSDYLYNIRAIARSGMVGIRTAGFAASILSAYDRTLTKPQPRKLSSHVGSIKERAEFDLIFKSSFEGSSTYGTFWKYTFNDTNGNVLVWLTSSPQNFDKDKKYRIRGTIKKHTEFKEVKQTEINRCEVVTTYE